MKAVLTITFCLLFGSAAPADGPRVFDEYGDLSFSDEQARLDNLALYLMEQPNSVVWYYIFAGTKSCAGEARRRAVRAKNYLVNKRGIQADRVLWVDEGYREDLVVELWLFPRDMRRPTPNNSSLDKSKAPTIRDCKSKRQKKRRRIKL